MLKLAMFGLDMLDRTSRALSANSQAALDIQGLNAQIANQKKTKITSRRNFICSIRCSTR